MSDLMALDITPETVRSDKTPEIAVRTTLPTDTWVLSWLPNRLLTFEQARSGMVLDEILSDPAPADPEQALEFAELRAAELGLTLPEVVVLLWDRYDQRPTPRRCAATGHPRCRPDRRPPWCCRPPGRHGR
ncbi:hypothetical protein [Nocardia concava]|uniref:hypothetical protein n=1 Tax=Nocardia concava TaxID=257281 RepID=UPI0007C47DB8|nr:hypothetical protein [Nocardia concava]